MARVLVVDDAEFVRMRMRRLLAEHGYEVVEADNGLSAVHQYRAEHPDLVFMDITMPLLDGISAVREIRKEDPGASIVMCSAAGQQAMVIEALKAGAKDFIIKPYQPEKILEAIGKFMHKGEPH
ncbi:MAG: response regulator [Thermaerobacter sp.]|nr:response regulator [Thermaerobacter sp.]